MRVPWLAFVVGLVLVLSWFWIVVSVDPVSGHAGRTAPSAAPRVKEAGLVLFEHDWKPGDTLAGGDGLGPVFNESRVWHATSRGVLAAGVMRNRTSPRLRPSRAGTRRDKGGVVHTFAISKECKESPDGFHDFFADREGGAEDRGGCRVEIKDFDPVRVHGINPTALVRRGLDRPDLVEEHRVS